MMTDSFRANHSRLCGCLCGSKSRLHNLQLAYRGRNCFRAGRHKQTGEFCYPIRYPTPSHISRLFRAVERRCCGVLLTYFGQDGPQAVLGARLDLFKQLFGAVGSRLVGCYDAVQFLDLGATSGPRARLGLLCNTLFCAARCRPLSRALTIHGKLILWVSLVC